jgi:hypothetical protein
MAKVKATADKVEKRITAVDNKSLGIINYDFDNLYPQRINDIVNNSGTAVTCLRMYSKYVMGGGAKDEIFYKSKVNSKGLTVDKLIRKMTYSKGKYQSIVLHVNYNGLLQITEASIVPFEYCRLVPQDDVDNAGKIAVYDDWGKVKKKSIDKKKVDFINIYNPSNVLQEVEEAGGWENYKGQILYWTPEGLEYPLAPYDSVLEDMMTEGQLKFFKNNTASKNFLASHLLIVGKSESEEDAEEFDNNLRMFQGGDGAGTLLVLERENNDEQIELKKVDIQNYDKLYEYTENSSRDSIIKNFLIPPVLLLRTAGSLGTSKEISDASDHYNTITYDDRLVIEEILKEIFSKFYYNICPSDDYSILPLKYRKAIEPDYFQYYTKNEIRESNGDAPADDLKSDTTLLAVTLGVGGTTALTSLLADPLLSVEQKKGSMMVLFGLTEAQSNQMLGL